MQRETFSVKLPVSDTEVVLNKYLIGREKRALANIYLDSGLAINGEGKIGSISSKVTDAAQDLAWKIVIVSIGGSSENIVESVLSLVAEDYDFIVSEVNKLTANKISTEKKTI